MRTSQTFFVALQQKERQNLRCHENGKKDCVAGRVRSICNKKDCRAIRYECKLNNYKLLYIEINCQLQN